jgi:hypothetical protein
MLSNDEGAPMTETLDRSDEARQNYANAPDPVQDIAAALFNGQSIPEDALAQTTPEMLSALYAAPTASGARRNLLLDAFGFDFLAQGETLVAAGADVNVADSLLARGAINKFAGSRLVPFPDFQPGMPWLRLYVENGGDTNAKDPTTPRQLIGQAAGVGNLEALLYLLEQGADGWLRIVEPDGYAHKPFFEAQASSAAGVTGGELLFRLAHAGAFKAATSEQLEPVMQTLETLLADKFDNTGPRAKRITWQLQQIIRMILSTSDAIASQDLNEMINVTPSDAQEGWHLPPDMVRSPPDTPEAELDYGTRVWTE